MERKAQDKAGGGAPVRRDRGLSGYRPLPGVPDELVDATGALRPLWRPLIDQLQALGDDELTRALGRADQYLRDSGVFYRQYGAGQSVERPWPLAHLPVLIHESDWTALSAALIQRADVLEALMADLYGPNRLVAEGHLPPALVTRNPEWLRPMVGVRPRSGHYLHFVAFEIGRGPDGTWWVLADRTQAPSGAGYALENRVATSRAFSDVYEGENIHRLAGFFRDFRDALLAMRTDRDASVAILTPGPLNETYYEQAWLARYLGFALVQGEDLAVEKGQLMLRTVAGLRPVDVLWRRLDASFADPLEMDPASRLGTPGMVSALRQGGLTMVNSLGSGVLETRALMAFLPQLAPHLVGAPLAMPNIATWWCGGAAERAAVLADPGRLVLSPALGTGLPYDRQGEPELAARLPRAELARRMATAGPALVAQEAVTLSTTPALVDGRIVPRPMSLRVFLARTATGWQVMPGGYARIGAAADPTAVAMQRGGAAADVWIVSDQDVPAISMVAKPAGPYRRMPPGALPSRAADNLFWLGRYVERVEGVVRLLRARNIRLAESGRAAAPMLKAIDPIAESYGIDPAQGIPRGLIDTLAAAIGSAGQIRDRFSPDGWSALADLDKTARRMASAVAPGDDAARALSALLRKLAGFSGLVNENMYRFLGWRFLTIGRQHERAMAMTGLLAALADDAAPPGALDLCVELGDSVLTHRRRFTMATSRETVIDLLALDPMNPRSIRHQLDGMMAQVQMLPGAADHGQLSDLGRAMLRCQTEVATETPETLTTEVLQDLRGRIAELSDLVTGAYLR
ncbi:circularly permuted type 2 ATP-grasp protein [Gemmobacter sp.]|uniref:circularly permuted type 2 ATP-grasp protein n=1 Tax=Gemmobacter sp. TaxID=1898957 RepID=UPI002AFFAF2C|nr:circularly permuted type 2 ATP-grasp protein [Gemmobacter sp.]